MAKLVTTYPGIIVHLRLAVLKQMVLLREQYAESRKELLQYSCNLPWMKSGGQIPWSATVICETFKTLYWTGKHLMTGNFENHLVGPQFASDL